MDRYGMNETCEDEKSTRYCKKKFKQCKKSKVAEMCQKTCGLCHIPKNNNPFNYFEANGVISLNDWIEKCEFIMKAMNVTNMMGREMNSTTYTGYLLMSIVNKTVRR